MAASKAAEKKAPQAYPLEYVEDAFERERRWRSFSTFCYLMAWPMRSHRTHCVQSPWPLHDQ